MNFGSIELIATLARWFNLVRSDVGLIGPNPPNLTNRKQPYPVQYNSHFLFSTLSTSDENMILYEQQHFWLKLTRFLKVKKKEKCKLKLNILHIKIDIKQE